MDTTASFRFPVVTLSASRGTDIQTKGLHFSASNTEISISPLTSHRSRPAKSLSLVIPNDPDVINELIKTLQSL